MSEIIITTTNSISGVEIEKYLGLVTTNLVIGTNVFSDFLASFSDFFGGMSGTYRNQLDLLYKRALDDLTNKANKKRADAILGIKIDFDEISGQGKSMFMVSITGTAVRFKHNSVTAHKDCVTNDDLQVEIFLHRWSKRSIYDDLSTSDWDIIFNNNLFQLAPSLYQNYLLARNNNATEASVNTVEKFPQFLSTLSYEDAVNVIYNDYENNYQAANKLIDKFMLFSPYHVLKLIENNNINRAVELLKYSKNKYTGDDIKLMQEILQRLDELPDVWKVESVKSGMLSSKKVDKYVCQCGRHNPIDAVYCDCGRNIKGLHYTQMNVIEAFKERVEVLEQIIK
jgi:uncharacterized protein YbjQ (UPF0145 family)